MENLWSKSGALKTIYFKKQNFYFEGKLSRFSLRFSVQ